MTLMNCIAMMDPVTADAAISEWEDELSLCENLRFQNGVLQAYCCGEWVNVSGQAAQGIGGPGQPGGGSTEPGIGQCVTYHASFAANSQWLVPVTVNAGDTITFSNAKGAGTDGGVSGLWNCPNSQTFFGGACVGVGGTKAGDVAPAINHMRLIAKIGSVWYPADAGTITVPGGISAAQVLIQANDSSIADNSGSYTLDVQVCNNQTATFTAIVDLTLTDGGLVADVDNGVALGVWVPGIGWQAVPYQAADGTWLTRLELVRNFASTPLTSLAMKYNLTKGAFGLTGLSNGAIASVAGASPVTVSVASNTDANGTGKVLSEVLSASYTRLFFLINARYNSTNVTPGSATLTQYTVTGSGASPF